MISRIKIRITEVTAILGFGIGIIADLADLDFLYIASIILMIAGILGNLIICHCPHCRMPLRRLSSIQSDPGYCPKCGSKIEFDE